MKRNIKDSLLYKGLGITSLLIGSSLFYTGTIGLLEEYVSSDSSTQFFFGVGLLVISYVIFNREIKTFI
jgi:hypothetical protein